MFDTVRSDPRRGPRLVPLLASFFVNSVMCAVVVVASQSRAAAVVEPPDDTIEVMIPLRAPSVEAASTPSGRPGSTRSKAPRAAAPVAVAPVVPTPPAAPSATATLDTQAGPPGPAGPPGDDGGDLGNGGGGGDDRPPGGDLSGRGSAVRVVHWSEASLLHACEPEMPDVMRQLGRSEEQCVVTVSLAANGEVVDVLPDSCPSFLLAAASRAARCSTFAGVGEPVRFRFRYVFRLN